MPRKHLLLPLIIVCVFLTACSPKEKSPPVEKPSQSLPPADMQGPKITVFLDSDNHSKIVLTINGWHDYHPGDVISAQGDNTGGGHDWEVVRGWFIVKPSTQQPGFWEPYLVRMYHVRTPDSQTSKTSATTGP